MTWHDWASIASIFLAGVFDAAQTARKDYCYQSVFVKWFGNSETLMRWYIGDPKYKNNMPWNSDFWHDAKFAWIYAWSIACGFQVLAHTDSFWLAAGATILFQFIEGFTFSNFYHKVFRIK